MRRPELGEVSAYCFYATKLRFRDLAFDIGANHGEHMAQMLNRGARVVALEPQAKLATELAKRFPAATVVAMAVSDEPGHGALHVIAEDDQLASMDADWADFERGFRTHGVTAAGSEDVLVTTLDELINEYGQPALVKIDTEGFDHRVLRGLTRPIDHIVFEVHAARRNDAAEALHHVERLGRYEYRLSPHETWSFCKPTRPEEILATLPDWGSVYAHRRGFTRV